MREICRLQISTFQYLCLSLSPRICEGEEAKSLLMIMRDSLARSAPKTKYACKIGKRSRECVPHGFEARRFLPFVDREFLRIYPGIIIGSSFRSVFLRDHTRAIDVRRQEKNSKCTSEQTNRVSKCHKDRCAFFHAHENYASLLPLPLFFP